MSDIMTILALMFGFALLCVIGVVYLLSKRQISVVQNNSTSVTTERTDSSTGGSGRVERFLIKWTFILLVAGIAIATLANAVAMSFPNASVGNPQTLAIVATPAPMPTVAAPAHPLPLGEGRGDGVNPLIIINPLLAVVVIGIWTYAVIAMSNHRQRSRLIGQRRASAKREAQREAQLESMLPDSINQL